MFPWRAAPSGHLSKASGGQLLHVCVCRGVGWFLRKEGRGSRWADGIVNVHVYGGGFGGGLGGGDGVGWASQEQHVPTFLANRDVLQQVLRHGVAIRHSRAVAACAFVFHGRNINWLGRLWPVWVLWLAGVHFWGESILSRTHLPQPSRYGGGGCGDRRACVS